MPVGEVMLLEETRLERLLTGTNNKTRRDPLEITAAPAKRRKRGTENGVQDDVGEQEDVGQILLEECLSEGGKGGEEYKNFKELKEATWCGGSKPKPVAVVLTRDDSDDWVLYGSVIGTRDKDPDNPRHKNEFCFTPASGCTFYQNMLGNLNKDARDTSKRLAGKVLFFSFDSFHVFRWTDGLNEVLKQRHKLLPGEVEKSGQQWKDSFLLSSSRRRRRGRGW